MTRRVADKPMPTHVAEQRARVKAKRPTALSSNPSEPYDVFRRINMHGGDKEPCWEWRGAHGLGTRGEYRPRVSINQKHFYVYRVVYELYTGYKLQEGEVVRHQCDHSWCCNPHHMIIGRQLDNVHDMLERERVGMKHFHVKRIMQMLEIGASAAYVCGKMRQGYNMSLDESTIRKIRMRRIYKHIDWPWGDQWAAARRARLADIKKQRLASDPSSGIMSSEQDTEHTNTEGATTHAKHEAKREREHQDEG